jgi:hypothetical protein
MVVINSEPKLERENPKLRTWYEHTVAQTKLGPRTCGKLEQVISAKIKDPTLPETLSYSS